MMAMKNIIVMMMCIVALFSCSSDNDAFGGRYKVEEPIIEKEIGYFEYNKNYRLTNVDDFKFIITKVTTNVYKRWYHYNEGKYSDNGYWTDSLLYEGFENFTLNLFNDELFTYSNTTMSVGGSSYGNNVYIRNKYTFNIKDDTIILSDNFIDGIKLFYEGVIVQRADRYLNDLHCNKKHTDEFKDCRACAYEYDEIYKAVEEMYRPILNELVPQSTVGKIKKDDNFITITFKCASGEKDFVFHIE